MIPQNCVRKFFKGVKSTLYFYSREKVCHCHIAISMAYTSTAWLDSVRHNIMFDVVWFDY